MATRKTTARKSTRKKATPKQPTLTAKKVVETRIEIVDPQCQNKYRVELSKSGRCSFQEWDEWDKSYNENFTFNLADLKELVSLLEQES